MIYLETNVFEESLNRIRWVYDNCDDVIVSMSGGKDSTVLFHLALQVAKERDRLPLKVFWLDQEAEWQSTVDYMDEIMRMPEVDPYWYQVKFAFPNNLSTDSEHKTLWAWDEKAKDKWIHPQSDIAITESPIYVDDQGRDDAFYTLVKHLPEYISPDSENCAVLIGMRIQESPRRRMSIVGSNNSWRGITWCSNAIGNTRKFWPIYDFTNEDIWTAIAKNHWKYNKVYDLQYQWGVSRSRMRVSALIHETAWASIEQLQEFEPKTYNRFLNRVAGTSAFNHAFTDEGDIIPRKLPFAFKDWKEYRDYLLEKLIPPESRAVYIKRWRGQDGDEWYKVHVREVILDDSCGTINQNAKYGVESKIRLGGKYKDKWKAQFDEYMEGKK